MKKLLFLFYFSLFNFVIYSQLPNINLKDVNGNNKNLSKLSNNGNPIIISFWATWCKPCKAELNTIAEEYDDVLQDADVYIQRPANHQVHNYHKYTVRLKDKQTRNTISNQLKLSIHYDKPISENGLYDLTGQPNAKIVSDTILTLPNHPYMTSKEIEKIAIVMSMI